VIPAFDSDEDLRGALLDRIFESRQGECLDLATLEDLYCGSRQGMPVKRLAHIVSCRRCLDLACRITGSTPLPSGEESRRSSDRAPARNEPPLERWRQNRSSILRAAPVRLSVAVNGRILGTQAVTPGRNEFTVYIPFETRLEFIEIFDERGTRVLFFPVLELPPDGKFVQRSSLSVESGRRLDLQLNLEGPWPAVEVVWDGPCSAQAPAAQPKQEAAMFRVQSPSRRWTWPTLSTATAGLLILLLTLDLARPSRMNAAQVLSAASEWESSTVEGREVLYRRYRLTTRSAAGTEPRTLAVWRSLATRERRLELSDGRGKVIATSLWRGDVPSPTAENLWQFEPAADVFEALAPKGELIAVSTNTLEIRLGTSSVDMSVDRDTHRPKMLTIRRGGEELRVSEISHEALPSLPPAALIALPGAYPHPQVLAMRRKRSDNRVRLWTRSNLPSVTS
jgi:hypothetical protein